MFNIVKKKQVSIAWHNMQAHSIHKTPIVQVTRKASKTLISANSRFRKTATTAAALEQHKAIHRNNLTRKLAARGRKEPVTSIDCVCYTRQEESSLGLLGVFSRDRVVADGALSDGSIGVFSVDVGPVLGRRRTDRVENRDVCTRDVSNGI
jgi:hypothetical protein